MTIEFTPLASGSGGNAYIVSDGNTTLLLEAGIPIKKLKQRAGFILSRIDACLLSHLHNDHCCGAKGIMQAGTDIYTSRETAEAKGLSGHRLHTIKPRQQFQVGSWTILPFNVPHDVQNLGFLLANQDGDKLLFAVDCFYVPYTFHKITHIAIGCNHSRELLRESVEQGHIHPELANRIRKNHMSLSRVQDMLKANDLSRVEEIHLLHLSDDNSNPDYFKSEIEKQVGIPTYIAQV